MAASLGLAPGDGAALVPARARFGRSGAINRLRLARPRGECDERRRRY
jgi:hypothetical protein